MLIFYNLACAIRKVFYVHLIATFKLSGKLQKPKRTNYNNYFNLKSKLPSYICKKIDNPLKQYLFLTTEKRN